MLIFLLIFSSFVGFFQWLLLTSLWDCKIKSWIMPVINGVILAAGYYIEEDIAAFVLIGLFIATFALAILGILFNGVRSAVQQWTAKNRQQRNAGLPPKPLWKRLTSLVITIVAPIAFLGSFFLLGPAGLFLVFFIVPLFIRALKARNPHSFLKLQEILPTSTIRSVANGLAEVEGRLVAAELLQAPVNQTGCIGFRFTVERRDVDSDGDVSYTTLEDRTQCNDFFIEDHTGKMAVSKDNLQLLWLPIDTQYSRNGKRYTQYLLEAGKKMLLIGEAQKDHHALPQMVQHATYQVFTIAPSTSVSRYNRYKPLMDAAFMYLGLFGLLIALIVMTPMEIQNGYLVIGKPHFFF